MTLYLNDIGVIGPLGAGKDEVRGNLLAGDDSGLTPFGDLLTGRTTMVGRARGALPAIPHEFADLDCRNNRLLQCALDEIGATVAELRSALGPARVAVVLGTSTSGIEAGEEAAAALAREGRMPSRYHYRQQEIGTAAEFAARYLELTGLRYTISTACSSSAKAFASAARLFAAGFCDAAIVGGVDSLCRLTLNGFDALESLSTEHRTLVFYESPHRLAKTLALMPKHAHLVNVARGAVCDEKALTAALQARQIAGAYLDVFEKEPLPADSPLWDIPNVIVSPHNASASAGNDARAATVFTENLKLYAAGKAMTNEQG